MTKLKMYYTKCHNFTLYFDCKLQLLLTKQIYRKIGICDLHTIAPNGGNGLQRHADIICQKWLRRSEQSAVGAEDDPVGKVHHAEGDDPTPIRRHKHV